MDKKLLSDWMDKLFNKAWPQGRALQEYDWAKFSDDLGNGDQPDRLSWALSSVFHGQTLGHFGWDATSALRIAERGLPDFDYELKKQNGGWFFYISSGVGGSSFTGPGFAVYQALCNQLERWKREAQSANSQKVG